MSLGQRIRQRREQLGLSQSALAQAAGVPQSRISEFESGTKDSMTLDTARRLARALGCSIDYLAGTWDSEAEAALGPTHPAVQPRRPRRRPRAKETNASATVAETA